MWQGIVVISIILITGIIFFSMSSFNAGLLPSTQSDPATERTITLEDIYEDPVVYRGLTVEVKGAIADWVTKRGFVIASQRGFGTANGVLVIQREEFRLPRNTPSDQLALGEKTEVTVRGTVREFDTVSAERELGVDLLDEEFIAWDNRAVIIAERITK